MHNNDVRPAAPTNNLAGKIAARGRAAAEVVGEEKVEVKEERHLLGVRLKPKMYVRDRSCLHLRQ